MLWYFLFVNDLIVISVIMILIVTMIITLEYPVKVTNPFEVKTIIMIMINNDNDDNDIKNLLDYQANLDR